MDYPECSKTQERKVDNDRGPDPDNGDDDWGPDVKNEES